MAKLSRSQMNTHCMYSVLNALTTEREIKTACMEVIRLNIPFIAINGSYVSFVAEELRKIDTKICAMIDFPFGTASIQAKASEVRDVLANGADEACVVLQSGRVHGAQWSLVRDEISTMMDAANGSPLTIVIESSYFDDEEKIKVCEIAKECGVSNIQTNTGFIAKATISDVSLIRQTVGKSVGVIASGGIRTASDMAAMLEAGASRVATSFVVSISQDVDFT